MKLTIKELAAHLHVSVETVRLWKRQRVIPYVQVKHVILFDLDKVERALSKYERKEAGV
jgi:excisionase family DNA binding protein